MPLFNMCSDFIVNYFNDGINIRNTIMDKWNYRFDNRHRCRVIKEIYDSRHKGKFDKKDLIADIFGTISGSVLGIIFILLT